MVRIFDCSMIVSLMINVIFLIVFRNNPLLGKIHNMDDQA